MGAIEDLLDNISGLAFTIILGWVWWRLCHTLEAEPDRRWRDADLFVSREHDCGGGDPDFGGAGCDVGGDGLGF